MEIITIPITNCKHPREAVLHAFFSHRYGGNVFELDYAEVLYRLGWATSTAKNTVARMQEKMMIVCNGAACRVIDPVPQSVPVSSAQPEPKATPPPAAKPKPEPKQADPLFSTYIEMWHNYLLQITGVGYKPTNAKAEGVAMNGILVKSRAIAKNTEGSVENDQNVILVWQTILAKMPALPDYYKPTKLTQVNERFTDIVNLIKNGTYKNNSDRSKHPTEQGVAEALKRRFSGEGGHKGGFPY